MGKSRARSGYVWMSRAVAVAALALVGAVECAAQRRTGPDRPSVGTVRPAPAAPAPQLSPVVEPRPAERIEVDVSSRSVAVTSGYSGTRIVVFGTVVDSRQLSAESGYYDIVIVLEGTPGEIVARKKMRTWGIWRNVDAVKFDGVPSYYAIVSTRPADELADKSVLSGAQIGYEYVRMIPEPGWEDRFTAPELDEFKASITRLKGNRDLYLVSPYGVSFIGRSLFRATVDLPANIPIGPLATRIHLFHDGKLLDTYRSRVVLQREGAGLAIHNFAQHQSVFYGIMTVLAAVAAGLAATTAFRHAGH